MELTEDGLVIFRPRPRTPWNELLPEIRLPEWAKDQARSIARGKGRDYDSLRSDRLTFARAESSMGNPPKNSGAAFLAFFNAPRLTEGNLV